MPGCLRWCRWAGAVRTRRRVRPRCAAGSIKDGYVGRLQGLRGPQGLPLFKPPFGRLTAIDLASGDHLWRVPLGEGPRHHPLLEPLQLGRLGWDHRGFPLATRTLLFVAQMGGGTLPVSESPGLEVFDKASGELIANVELPENATGALMTYFAGGKQYVVVPIGGRGRRAELVALTLP